MTTRTDLLDHGGRDFRQPRVSGSIWCSVLAWRPDGTHYTSSLELRSEGSAFLASWELREEDAGSLVFEGLAMVFGRQTFLARRRVLPSNERGRNFGLCCYELDASTVAPALRWGRTQWASRDSKSYWIGTPNKRCRDGCSSEESDRQACCDDILLARAIGRSDGAVELRWFDECGIRHLGIGYRFGRFLVAAWGPPNSEMHLLALEPGDRFDSLKGEWWSNGQTGTGYEHLFALGRPPAPFRADSLGSLQKGRAR